MFLFIYLFIFHRYREIPIGTKSDTIIKKFFKCNEVMKLSEELLILSNERLKDGNEWLKASIKQCESNIHSVNKCTIMWIIEAIICSMVFNVRQFRMNVVIWKESQI